VVEAHAAVKFCTSWLAGKSGKFEYPSPGPCCGPAVATKNIEMKQIINGREFDTIICKYRPINEWLYQTLREGSLWFADPETFNDYLEVKSYVEIAKPNPEAILALAESIMARGANRGNSLETLVRHFSDHSDELAAPVRKQAKAEAANTGICCFSQHDDVPLLWAHYADGDRGVCLKFDMMEDWSFFTAPIVVDYVDNIPSFDFLFHRRQPGALVQFFFGTKMSDWQYEKEIRVAKTGTLYLQHRGNICFDKRCLVEVIFGIRTPEDKMQEIKTLIVQAGYQSAFFRMSNKPGSPQLIKLPI